MLLAGKYRVERLLGEGGMGVVLAATNEALRQKVAIKLLRSGSLANAKALGRFEREARAAASLRSEHVARVLDVGKLDDGRPYMVMEYLEGMDLGDVIDQGPYLPVPQVVDYVLQASEAIAEAHAAGIIHRDLKPRNLFLATTVDGRPLIKVLDFGISKTEESNGEDMSLTRTTEIIGSPSYMSPEQLRASKEVDVRTDIWALGVILYELLTKKVPFQAVTVTDLVAVVLMEPTPDVRVERPDAPEGLVYAINRCLAKRREERFSSVAELVGALAPFGSALTSGIADRVTRVAQSSGRQLPPSDTGSGPYAHPRGPSGSLRDSSSGTGPGGTYSPPTVLAKPMQFDVAPPTVPIPSSDGYGPPPAAPYPHPMANGYGPNRGPIPSAAPSGMPVASGNAPPPASSARLAIHGGTSVAWGETQVEPGTPVKKKSRAPLVAAMVGLFALLSVGAGGAFVYKQRHPGPTTAQGPADSINLPVGRKDLPPMPPPPPPPAESVPEVASALPSARAPMSDIRDKPPIAAKPPASANAKTGGTKPPQPPPPTTAAKTAEKPDDLNNIGRR